MSGEANPGSDAQSPTTLTHRSELLLPRATLKSINTQDAYTALFLSIGSAGIGAALCTFQSWHIILIGGAYLLAFISFLRRQNAIEDIEEESEIETGVMAIPDQEAQS